MTKRLSLTNDSPLVSVIILNYNGKRFLDRCLKSVSNQLYSNYEIIFVDNNSTDDSVKFVEEHFPQIIIIRNEHNFGFSEGNNIGFRHAKGKYFIVLNTDTQVKQNFVSALVKVAENDEKIGSVSCKIVRGDGIIYDGPIFTNNGFVVPWIASVHSLKQYQIVCNQFNYNLGNCATATLYRRSVIEKIGGFDADFWACWEDFDLGFRICLSGFQSVHTPDTIVFHVGSGSFQGKMHHQIRCLRNRFFMLLKNYETKNVILRFFPFVAIFPVFLVLRIYLNEFELFFNSISVKSLSKTSAQKCVAFRKMYVAFFLGYLSFIRNLRSAVSKRATVQKLRTVSDKIIFSKTEKKSIL